MIEIYDENNKKIDTSKIEDVEQKLSNIYVEKDDIVLELGARYGSVSCVVNKILNNKENHVVVEPDDRVWEALEKNKKINNCKFNIIKGFISNKKLNLTNKNCYLGGYGSTFIFDENTDIPSYSLEHVKKQYMLNFNVLIADCEGFLETFFDENPSFYQELRLIIFECDYAKKCNYNKIKNSLKNNNFVSVVTGFHCVYIKK